MGVNEGEVNTLFSKNTLPFLKKLLLKSKETNFAHWA